MSLEAPCRMKDLSTISGAATSDAPPKPTRSDRRRIFVIVSIRWQQQCCANKTFPLILGRGHAHANTHELSPACPTCSAAEKAPLRRALGASTMTKTSVKQQRPALIESRVSLCLFILIITWKSRKNHQKTHTPLQQQCRLEYRLQYC